MTDLVVRQGEVIDALPVPVFTGDQMGVALVAYRELQGQLDKSMPDQIMEIEGRRFRKKGYWRAVAVAFDLRVEPIEEVRVDNAGIFHDGRPNFGYQVTYRASTRSGRTVTGDGACFAIEKARKFRCPHPQPGNPKRSEHWPHESCPDYDPEYRWREEPAQASEHNIRSHAHTRAFNRAISNLVGFGEVSAEEVDREEGDHAPGDNGRRSSPSPLVISEPQRKRLYAIASRHGWSDDETKTLIKKHAGVDHAAEITRDKYEAICTELEQGRKP